MNVCVPFHELVVHLCIRARFGHPPAVWVPDLKPDEWTALRAGLAEAVRDPDAFDALFVLYFDLPDPDEPGPLPDDLMRRALGEDLLDVTDAELVQLLTTPVWVVELRDAHVERQSQTGRTRPGYTSFTAFARDPARRADLQRRLRFGLPGLLRELGASAEHVEPLVAFLDSKMPIPDGARFRDEFPKFVAAYAAQSGLNWQAVQPGMVALLAEAAAVRTVLDTHLRSVGAPNSFSSLRKCVDALAERRPERVTELVLPDVQLGSFEHAFAKRILIDAEGLVRQYLLDFDANLDTVA